MASIGISGCSGGGGTGSLPAFEASLPHSSDSTLQLPGGAQQYTSASSAFSANASATGTQSSQTLSAFALYDSVGVNTHLSSSLFRANYPGVITLLANLGARHIREGINPSIDHNAMALQKTIFQQYGIDSTETTAPGDPVSAWAAYKNGIGSGMVAIEGENEPDNHGSYTNFVGPTLALQKQIWNAVHGGSPALAGLQVEGPSILSCKGAANYGDRSAYTDFANMHRYFGGFEPNTSGWGGSTCGTSATYGSLAFNVAVVQQAAVTRPIRTTETGYCTAPVHGCVPQNVAAEYEPQIFTTSFMYNASAGSRIPRTYIYELVSENSTNSGSSLGLTNANFSPKPMYYAVQGFISHLKDVPGAASGSLSYSINGTTAGLKAIPLRYSNGDYGIILYNSTAVWNPNGSATSQGSPISVPDDNIVFSVPGQTMNHLVSSTYDGSGRWTDSAPASLQQAAVAVNGYMHILRWSTGSSPTPPPSPTPTPAQTPTATATPTWSPSPTPTPSVSPSASPAPGNAVAIDAGGLASGSWIGDAHYSSGRAAGVYYGAIDRSAVTSPAPSAVYQSARVGTAPFSYTLQGLGAGSARTVRLHFSENYVHSAGQRSFDVALSGTNQALSGFDILAQAGARHKAVVVEFDNVAADASGTIVVTLTPRVNDASINGIEVY